MDAVAMAAVTMAAMEAVAMAPMEVINAVDVCDVGNDCEAMAVRQWMRWQWRL